MATDTVVRARIDAETKNQATAALAAMGLSISDFIRMALVQVAFMPILLGSTMCFFAAVQLSVRG